MEQRRKTALNLNMDCNINAIENPERLRLILKDVLELIRQSRSVSMCVCRHAGRYMEI